MEQAIDIFRYMDFRRFMGDAYLAARQVSRRFSYRYFTERAGLKAPIHLKLVVDGKRNLTSRTARGYARAFGLDAPQTRFFLRLVSMNQAKTTEERAHHYRRLSEMPRYRDVRRLERWQFEYYSRWYCAPIRELVIRGGFREDASWIARQLRPRITPQQARDALELLLRLRLLERDADGQLVAADALLSTGPELRSLAARNFHREMLHVAAGALDEVALEERQVGGITLRLGAEQVAALKQRVFEFGSEVLSHDGAYEGPQTVYHFAFQLFPVSEPGLEGDDAS